MEGNNVSDHPAVGDELRDVATGLETLLEWLTRIINRIDRMLEARQSDDGSTMSERAVAEHGHDL